ncbi:hypothetical protein BDN72DRAFT_659573 [Pluteus cervinus]|uniref:Uncharacterized protein n=1 Tax=Pluteus cervinus TaxID=181527 RepID=A0ACD3ASA5_9AGAR|nr:hypothetical protein BDN72DRAFT_659573 [Pluteus cervinus]
MSSRLFALVVAIDSYKSGNIWNLHSCVDDAHKIRDWLELDLHVPKSHICVLLDHEATKRSIEDNFTQHLTNNASIAPGDAILIYFAGHGSSIPAPPGWFRGDSSEQQVEVICTYDHDMKCPGGRIAGISDRSLGAMLQELAAMKGDNITLVLDCSFPPLSTSQESHRSHTRQTPTLKATPFDLHHGLWPSSHPQSPGFFRRQHNTHLLLAACDKDEQALEDKLGGHFTHAFLEVAPGLELHQTSYSSLLEQVGERMPAVQRPICLGSHKGRAVFNGRAFAQDPRYGRAYLHTHVVGGPQMLEIDFGEIHGVTVGTTFSLHAHNFKGSHNPSIGRAVACSVTPVSCCANVVSIISGYNSEGHYWANIVRWHTESPFRIRLEATMPSVIRKWKLLRRIPYFTHPGDSELVRVDKGQAADLSVSITRNYLTVEHQSHHLLANNPLKVASVGRDDCDVLTAAARFHMQLGRSNPLHPLQSFIDMELYRLDPSTWLRTGWNVLDSGNARLWHQTSISSVGCPVTPCSW